MDPVLSGIKIESDEATVIMGTQEGEVKSNTGSGVLPMVEVASLMEKAKFYTSLCLGTTAILAVFAFLFLIPFVVEPAISTILADFSPHAVACVATDHVYAEGLRNCSWASCREGEYTPTPSQKLIYISSLSSLRSILKIIFHI